MPGANSPDNTTVDDDPPDRGCRERDSKAGVRSTGDSVIYHEVADVACIPKSHLRTCRTAQEVRRWRIWL